jgi:hypothetical protein
MNKILTVILLLVSGMLIPGCRSGGSPLSYMKGVETSDALNRHSKEGEVNVSAHFRPSGYLAYRELLKQGVVVDSLLTKKEDFEREKRKFSGGVYFEVRFAAKDGSNMMLSGISNQKEYAIRTDYLNNSVFRDFYILLDDLTKVRPSGHSYQNTFGAGKSCDLNLVFPVDVAETEGEIELIYEDRIFGLKQKKRIFTYDAEELKKWSTIN